MTIFRYTMKLSICCVCLTLASSQLFADFTTVLDDAQVSVEVKEQLQGLSNQYADYYGGEVTDSGFADFLSEVMAQRIDSDDSSPEFLEALLNAGAKLDALPLPLALKVLEKTGGNHSDYRTGRLERDKIEFLSILAKTEDEYKAKHFQDTLVQAVYEQDQPLSQWLIEWTRSYQDISDEERAQALNNALFASIEESSIELSKVLLNGGAAFNPNEQGDTVLDLAIERGDLPSLQLLIKHGAPLNNVDKHGLNLLQKSINEQHFAMAGWLLEQGVPADVQGRLNEEADYGAWSAPSKPDYPLFLLLKNWPAQPSEEEQQARTQLLDQLLSKTKQLDILDQESNSLLFVAFESKNNDLLDHLLEQLSKKSKELGESSRIEDSYKDSYGNSFLHKLIKEKRFAQALNFAKELDIAQSLQTKADRFGYTPAQTLLYLGFPENVDSGEFNAHAAQLLSLLVQNPSQVAHLDTNGNSLLHLAYNREYQGLKDWLSKVININAPNSKGQSLLHLAVLNGDEGLCEALIKNGASVDLADAEGETPVSLAIKQQQRGLSSLLLSNSSLNNSSLNYRLKNGDNLLHRAASVGNRELIARLIQAGVSVTDTNNEAYLPVHLAISNGYKEAAKQLMKAYPLPATGENAAVSTAASSDSENSDFADPRVVYWSSLYWANMRSELLAHVEQDLLSNKPHVLAPHVWVTVHDVHDQLDRALAAAEPRIQAQVQRLADIKLLEERGEYQELFKRFPPELNYTASEIFGLSDLAFAAKAATKFELSYRYRQKAILLKPDSWQALWGFQDAELLNSPAIRSQAQAFASHPKLKGTLAGEFLTAVTQAREWGTPSSLQWTKKWLERYPNDIRALTDRAFDLRNIKEFDQALKLSQKADLLFPFYGNRDLTPEILVRLGKIEQAKRVANTVAARFDYENSPYPTKPITAVYFGEALRKAGDLGKARTVLEEAIAQWPTVARLQKELGLLERKDKRYNQAAEHFEKVVTLKSEPSNGDYSSLIDIYVKSKQYSKAKDLSQILLAKPRYYSQALYLDMFEAALKTEAHALIDQIIAHAKTHSGVDADLQIALYKYQWEQGKQQEVLAGLNSLVEQRPSHTQALKTWLEKLQEVEGLAGTEEALSHHIDKFPWLSSAWEQLIELTAAPDKGLAIWQKANGVNQSDSFACQKISGIYIGKREYDLAQATLDQCKQALARANLETSQRYYLEQLWLLEKKSKRLGLSADELALARKALQQYKLSYAPLNNAYRYEVSIELAAGNKEKALAALEKRAELNPDSTSIYHSFAADFGETNNGYGYRLLERQPLNQAVLNSYLHKQVLWGGSPVNALRAIDRAKKRGVYFNENWQRRALSQLGDPLTSFERYWSGGEFPGSSQRYLNWFDSARETALKGDRKQVIYNFDQNQAIVKIISADGEVYERNDHPVFSKFKSLRKGAAFVAFDYNKQGDLVRAHNSTGESIQLSYNEDGQIASMKDLKGRVLRFNYDKALGKPNFIMMQGTGMIHVEYDAEGEIEKVSSESGHKMALQVTQAFQNLLRLVKHSANERYLDKLFANTVDEKLQQLETQLAQSVGEYAKQQAKLELATYLVSQVQANKDYIKRADNALYSIFAELSYAEDAERKSLAVKAVSAWHQLYLAVRPYGLSASDYSRWRAMRSWLNEVAYLNEQFKAVDQRIANNELELLKQGQWLNRHDINVTGFWQRHGVSSLVAENKATQQSNAVLIRSNGDILVASNDGFSVFKEGFWQRYRLDKLFGKFSMNVESLEQNGEDTILSLAETSDGVLWLGTANGLFALQGAYDNEPKRWQTESQGLASPRINNLSVTQDQLLIATARGLSVAKGVDIISRLEGVEGDVKRAFLLKNGDVLFLKNQTISLRGIDGLTRELANKVTEMTVDSELQFVYWLSGERFYRQAIDKLSSVKDATPIFLGATSDLLINKSVLALSTVYLEGYGELFTVSTDRGLNFYRGNYFESMPLPLAHLRAGINLGASAVNNRGADLALATSEAVYSFQPSLAIQEKVGRVYDSVVDAEQGLTFIATGREIRYVDHKQPELGARYFHSANAKKLRLDQEGNLITHDGLRVLRIKRGSTEAEQLFSANQSTDDKKWRGNLSDIFMDNSNTLWVAAGSSVFRLASDMDTAEEFNYFINAEKFPAYSDMIHSIYQDLDGKLRVVASNESHRKHNGVSLSGGVLEWNGKTFKNLDAKANWFVTGYTKIDEDTAIVSTNQHFAREHNGQRESYKAMDDLSYNTLTNNHPMIWLGGEGAQMPNSKTWLFPSAGGVVAYRQGKWFYPERINQLLIDDQSLGRYGARTVHTVSVDNSNQIYIGTDRGLLIYKSQGVASLLNDNQLGQLVFQDKDGNQQRELRDIFLNKVDPNSKAGKLLSQYKLLEQELAQIAETQARGKESQTEAAQNVEKGSAENQAVPANNEEFAERLRKRERKRQRLLARLEKEHFGLYQMLKLDPREIAAFHNKLAPNQALVQYLPTPEKLLIQVVTQQGAIIKEVSVSESEIREKSLAAASILRAQAQRFTADGQLALRGLVDKNNPLQMLTADSHIAPLQWLYHYLLRPVETELGGKDQVFITPVSSLTYVPFSALIRSNEGKTEYAVNRYNIGILPSMYHFNLVMQQDKSFSEKGLLIADPDGSLPGARVEVQRIANLLDVEKTVLVGEQADLDSIKTEVSDSRVVHFATHGVLNTEDPADSYLLLAGKYQLNVIDIAELNLEQTDLVVLSACESGIGGSGLEYATIARAFAHASVPSVIASYWQVSDSATQELMSGLYPQFEQHPSNNFAALAAAKRALINSNTSLAHPAAWSGFEVFGKP